VHNNQCQKKKKDLVFVKECHQLVTASEGHKGVNTGSPCKGFIPFNNKAVTIVENVVCCVKFSAVRAVSLISGSRAEAEGVVCGEAVTGGDLEGSALKPVRPGRQHSFDTRVQLDTQRVGKDRVVLAVVGTGDRCPVGILLKEYLLFGGGRGKDIACLASVCTNILNWISMLIGLADPQSAYALIF
jgi:hypothetical protein